MIKTKLFATLRAAHSKDLGLAFLLECSIPNLLAKKESNTLHRLRAQDQSQVGMQPDSVEARKILQSSEHFSVKLTLRTIPLNKRMQDFNIAVILGNTKTGY